MTDQSLVPAINQLFGLSLPEGVSAETLRKQLADHISNLINTNFPSLIQLLYRIDVSEQRLRQTLAANPDKDASEIIADMIIERQWQKIKTRQSFRNDAGAGDW